MVLDVLWFIRNSGTRIVTSGSVDIWSFRNLIGEFNALINEEVNLMMLESCNVILKSFSLIPTAFVLCLITFIHSNVDLDYLRLIAGRVRRL